MFGKLKYSLLFHTHSFIGEVKTDDQYFTEFLNPITVQFTLVYANILDCFTHPPPKKLHKLMKISNERELLSHIPFIVKRKRRKALTYICNIACVQDLLFNYLWMYIWKCNWRIFGEIITFISLASLLHDGALYLVRSKKLLKCNNFTIYKTRLN